MVIRLYITLHFLSFCLFTYHVAAEYFWSVSSDVPAWMFGVFFLSLFLLTFLEVSISANLGNSSDHIQKFSWDAFSAVVGFFNQSLLYLDILFLIRLYKIIPSFLYIALPAFMMGSGLFGLLLSFRHIIGMFFLQDQFGIDIPSTFFSCFWNPASHGDAVDVFANAHETSLAARIAQRRRAMGLRNENQPLNRFRRTLHRWIGAIASKFKFGSASSTVNHASSSSTALLGGREAREPLMLMNGGEQEMALLATRTSSIDDEVSNELQSANCDDGVDEGTEDEEEEFEEEREIENQPKEMKMIQVFATGCQMQQLTVTTQMVNLLALTSVLRRDFLTKERHERVEFASNVAHGMKCMLTDMVLLSMKFFTLLAIDFSALGMVSFIIGAISILLSCCQVTTYPIDDIWDDNLALSV